MDRGDLVPDDVIIGMVEDELRQAGNVLFDGFPRTLAQAEALRELLQLKGRGQPAVVVFDIDDEEIVRRLLARQREDDRPETIRNRLDVYRQETEPLIDYYKQTLGGNVHHVPAQLTVDEVAQHIAQRLDPARRIAP
jgi:adenylate kinase